MSKKLKKLTPDIVREELRKADIIPELEGDHAKAFCLDKWDAEFNTSSSGAEGHEDIIIYSETTADDYQLWVCTDNHNGNININEDVYYYQENDPLAERALEALRHGGSVWIDPYLAEEMQYDISEAFTYAYQDEYEELFDNMRDELLHTGDYEDYKEE